MTDSRAALEERARAVEQAATLYWDNTDNWVRDSYGNLDEQQMAANFAWTLIVKSEQESSSLKLLLSAMCRGNAEVRLFASLPQDAGIFVLNNPDGDWEPFPHVKLDSSGIPVLTEEILKALEAVK